MCTNFFADMSFVWIPDWTSFMTIDVIRYHIDNQLCNILVDFAAWRMSCICIWRYMKVPIRNYSLSSCHKNKRKLPPTCCDSGNCSNGRLDVTTSMSCRSWYTNSLCGKTLCIRDFNWSIINFINVFFSCFLIVSLHAFLKSLMRSTLGSFFRCFWVLLPVNLFLILNL